MEQKYELIPSDYITIKNPLTSQPVKLYRILALRDLTIKINPTEYTSTIAEYYSIPKYSIGGYIESIENLSVDDESWVSGTAKIFGGAKITMDSIVTDDAIVYGNVLVEKSFIGGSNRTHMKKGSPEFSFKVHNCIFSDKSTVEGSSNESIFNTVVINSGMLQRNKRIMDCVITGGSFIVDSIVKNTKLFNVSGIKRSNISNCELYDRFTYLDTNATNETMTSVLDLNFVNGGN